MSANIIVVMGVAGSGKTTVGSDLAEYLNAPFIDADDHHPAANIKKMAAGQALTDQDRGDWLATLATMLNAHHRASTPVVLACSALKAHYRDRLNESGSVQFVYLRISRQCARERITARIDHYMPASLIDSQFAILEEPATSSDTGTAALTIDATEPVEVVCARIRRAFS